MAYPRGLLCRTLAFGLRKRTKRGGGIAQDKVSLLCPLKVSRIWPFFIIQVYYKESGRTNHKSWPPKKTYTQKGLFTGELLCRKCGLQEKTVKHLISECTCLDQKRTQTFGSLTKGQIFLQDNFGRMIIIKFLDFTGLLGEVFRAYIHLTLLGREISPCGWHTERRLKKQTNKVLGNPMF